MNIDLTGQTAVVTGVGRGIGLAGTRVLTASAAHVIAATRPSCAELDQLAAERTVTTFEVDLAVLGDRPEDVASGAAGAGSPPVIGGAGMSGAGASGAPLTCHSPGAVYLLAIGDRYTAGYGQQHKAAAGRRRRDAGDAR